MQLPLRAVFAVDHSQNLSELDLFRRLRQRSNPRRRRELRTRPGAFQLKHDLSQRRLWYALRLSNLPEVDRLGLGPSLCQVNQRETRVLGLGGDLQGVTSGSGSSVAFRRAGELANVR